MTCHYTERLLLAIREWSKLDENTWFDQSFFLSCNEQYLRRNKLSDKQIACLENIVRKCMKMNLKDFH